MKKFIAIYVISIYIYVIGDSLDAGLNNRKKKAWS